MDRTNCFLSPYEIPKTNITDYTESFWDGFPVPIDQINSVMRECENHLSTGVNPKRSNLLIN
jgi:hypothetical protein